MSSEDIGLPDGLPIELVDPFFWSIGSEDEERNFLKVRFCYSRRKIVSG